MEHPEHEVLKEKDDVTMVFKKALMYENARKPAETVLKKGKEVKEKEVLNLVKIFH
jgi:hypothetical protein